MREREREEERKPHEVIALSFEGGNILFPLPSSYHFLMNGVIW